MKKGYGLTPNEKIKIIDRLREEFPDFGIPSSDANHYVVNKMGFLVELTYNESTQTLIIDLQKNIPFFAGFFWKKVDYYYTKVKKGDFKK